MSKINHTGINFRLQNQDKIKRVFQNKAFIDFIVQREEV